MTPSYRLDTIIRNLVADLQGKPGAEQARTHLISAAMCLESEREEDTAGCAEYVRRACACLQAEPEWKQCCRILVACEALILCEKAIDVAKKWPTVSLT